MKKIEFSDMLSVVGMLILVFLALGISSRQIQVKKSEREKLQAHLAEQTENINQLKEVILQYSLCPQK